MVANCQGKPDEILGGGGVDLVIGPHLGGSNIPTHVMLWIFR